MTKDAVVVHIVGHELVEAAQAVIGSESADAHIGLRVVQSLGSVVSRHLMTAASQNRATQFVISLPLPQSVPTMPPCSDATKVRLVHDQLCSDLSQYHNSTTCRFNSYCMTFATRSTPT